MSSGGFEAAAAAALAARGRRLAPRTQDAVFRWLSKAVSGLALGQVLDAGTGPESLQWLSRQKAETITAVTACAP